MKITVKAGESLEDALAYVTEFLAEQLKTYPLLAGNLNIYFNLKDSNGLICPLNMKEYSISSRAVIDVEEKIKCELRNAILARWRNSLRLAEKNLQIAQEAVNRDEAYLKNAEENGKRQDLINKRQVQYAHHQEQADHAKKALDHLHALDDSITAGRATFQYICYDTKYTHPEEVCIFFDNIDGFTGNFSKYGLRAGSYID